MNTKMVIQFQSHNELADLLTLLQEKVASNPGWKSVMDAVKNARPLSELCEEEAKQYDKDAEDIKKRHTYTNGEVIGVWDSIHRMQECDKVETIAQAIRSFGSKQ